MRNSIVPVGAMAPPPVRLPTDRTTMLRPSALMPSGATRTSACSVSMKVSALFGTPAKAATAAIFDPRSKSLTRAFAMVRGPVMTSRSSGPLMARSTSSVPSRIEAPAGSVTPMAGSAASSSDAGIWRPASFMWSAVRSVPP